MLNPKKANGTGVEWGEGGGAGALYQLFAELDNIICSQSKFGVSFFVCLIIPPLPPISSAFTK